MVVVVVVVVVGNDNNRHEDDNDDEDDDSHYVNEEEVVTNPVDRGYESKENHSSRLGGRRWIEKSMDDSSMSLRESRKLSCWGWGCCG